MTEAAGMKRVNEGVDNSWEGGKKMRADSMTLRFLLKSQHAGGIIGKGGETIKRLRSTYSANVTVPDTSTQERILTIVSDQENAMNALRECLPLVHEAPYAVNNQSKGVDRPPAEFEINWLVHSSQVGGIIGKGGSKINEIRTQTNAYVKVYPDCLPESTERVVGIAGSADQIISTLEIMFLVQDENPIKGSISPYDASVDHSYSNYEQNNYNSNNNYNNGPPQQRGGFRGGRGGPRGGMGGGPRGGMGGGPRGGMGGGPGGNFGGNFGGNYGNYGGMGTQQDFSNNSYGGGYGGGGDWNNWNQQQGGYGGPPAGGNFFNQQQGDGFGGPAPPAGGNQGGTSETTPTQVTVPNDMAGAIIGKAGERIRQIRSKSGADIKFTDPEPGKNDRVITIKGTNDQVQYAQYLMQQCVHQHYTGPNKI